MASNWPPPWMNDRPHDPEPGPSRYVVPQRADSPQLSMPPPGSHPEIGLSQLPVEGRSHRSHTPGRTESHRARSHNGYMPDPQQAAPAWPSTSQQQHNEIYDDPSTPMAHGQQEHPWVPSQVPGSNTTVPQDLVATHHKAAKQEDIALLLELHCVLSHLIGAPDVLKLRCSSFTWSS